MRASSDTIAQLAAAMAKAQSELMNPVKSLTAILSTAMEAAQRATAKRRYHLGSILRKSFGK